MQTISRQTAEHYTWGGPQRSQCDGWHLVKTRELSIIEELVPPPRQMIESQWMWTRPRCISDNRGPFNKTKSAAESGGRLS
jgi:hypothetical protein